MKRALLVIDVQESFRARPYWRADEYAPFLAHSQRLIDEAQQSDTPVLQIFHEDPGGPDEPFSAASGLVRSLAELRIQPTEVFRKSVHSALYGRNAAGVTLETWLRQHGIEEVVITGIRTEQCCETTARHASDAGFKVRYVTAATLTFTMRHSSGREYSPAELRERTELVLADRFARIVSPAEAFA